MDKQYESIATDDFVLFRLNPGADLKQSLASIIEEHKVEKGTIMTSFGRVKPVNVISYRGPFNDEKGYELLSGWCDLSKGLEAMTITFAGADFKVKSGYLRDETTVLELVTGMIAKNRTYDKVVSSAPAFEIEPGEKLYDALQNMTQASRKLSGGIIITGGQLVAARVAFFNSSKKAYEEKVFSNGAGYELVSGQGTIALEDMKIKPHIHVTFKEGDQLYGGHLLEALTLGHVIGYIINVPGIKAERKQVAGSDSKLITFSKAGD
jgi:predicted DNA-binding protein with PD1-like motif